PPAPDAPPPITYALGRAASSGAAPHNTKPTRGGRLAPPAAPFCPRAPRRANSGYVVVLDDLTELLRAQKAAAWQEVARRIAHEIKNPLTPIQLSAQRLLRYLEKRSENGAAPAANDSDLTRLVEEA